jgi:hypothetical protein
MAHKDKKDEIVTKNLSSLTAKPLVSRFVIQFSVWNRPVLMLNYDFRRFNDIVIRDKLDEINSVIQMT